MKFLLYHHYLPKQPAIHEITLRCNEHEGIRHSYEHLKAKHSVDLLCYLAKFIVHATQVD